MTVETLLADLEPLSHTDRVRFMVNIGRRSLTNASDAAILATLEQRDFYERFLSLQSCFGSRDSAHVLRSLTDQSQIIRSLAVKLVPLTCDTQQMRFALTTVPASLRVPLIWKLFETHHQDIIDAFLNDIASQEDRQFASILPFGSPTIVALHHEQFLRHANVPDWRRLANLHPTIALENLQKRAEALTVLDHQFVWLLNGILPILARKQTDRAITLITTAAQHIPLSHFKLQCLVQPRPAEVAALILNSGEQIDVNFTRSVHRLDVNQIIALIERYSDAVNIHYASSWLRKLAPEQRVAIYAACRGAFLNQYGALPEWLLTLLPRTQREEEGHHHLSLASLLTRPAQRLPYAAFLPWHEAVAVLEPFTHNADADLRAKALGTLITSVRYQRSHLTDVLRIVLAHNNDQDPVRMQMLHSLAELPRIIWRQEHLESLDAILQGAFDAIDTSPGTMNATLMLILSVLSSHPEWGAKQLALNTAKYGIVAYHHKLTNYLSHADIQYLDPALLPVFALWEKQARDKELQVAAQQFAPYLKDFETLVDVLERTLQRTPSSAFASSVLSLLIQYCPRRARTLIPSLLEHDSSWITQPVICRYLHRHRQDLLTPFLQGKAYSGHFGNSNNSASLFLPLYDQSYRPRRGTQRYMLRGFFCWTLQQQEQYAQVLQGVIYEAGQSNRIVISAIAQLAALPAVTSATLLALAYDHRPLVRDTSLLALAHLDDGQGIPVLLKALHDDRVRVAIYALYNYLVNAPEQETLAILRTVPLEKVTVAKEVMRILGALSSEEAYRTLLSFHQQNLHIDVRIALTRVLWNHLHRPETWQLLEQTARSSDIAIALSSVRLRLSPDLRKEHAQVNKANRAWRGKFRPHKGVAEWTRLNTSRISPYRLTFEQEQRLMHLFVLLLHHPQLEVRITTLRYCTRIAEADQQRTLLTHVLEAMNSPIENVVKASAAAIFGTCIAADAPFIGEAIKRLQHNRRALQIAVQVLQGALYVNRRQLLPTVRQIVTVLTTDSRTASLRAELAISTLPWDEVATLLAQLAATNELHADALHHTCQAMQEASARPDFIGMQRLETQFATNEDERLRRIALASLLAQTQSPHGWNNEQLERLQSYRADPSPLVSETAQFTFPVVEQE